MRYRVQSAKTEPLIRNPLAVTIYSRLRRGGGVRGLSEMSQAGKIRKHRSGQSASGENFDARQRSNPRLLPRRKSC